MPASTRPAPSTVTVAPLTIRWRRLREPRAARRVAAPAAVLGPVGVLRAPSGEELMPRRGLLRTDPPQHLDDSMGARRPTPGRRVAKGRPEKPIPGRSPHRLAAPRQPHLRRLVRSGLTPRLGPAPH